MATFVPSGESLGCRVEGLDLSQPLGDDDFAAIVDAFARYGVLCFPDQRLTPQAQKIFAARFGALEINVAAGRYTVPGHREVMILSNIIEDGQPIGLSDAGQGWHTDMSYSEPIAYLNVLYAVEVPMRGGVALGATEFIDMRAAYAALPAEWQQRIAGKTATHDFNKFWDMMVRTPGTHRTPLTPEQRRQKPPVSHPIVLRHPVSGEPALYCNVGYVVRVDGVSEAESEEILDVLFAHQLQDRFKYVHRWRVGDVLAWDNLWTMHRAVADYAPEERRLMRRCQVMADRVMSGRLTAA